MKGGPIQVPLTAGWLARQAAAGRVHQPGDAVDPIGHRDATRDADLEQVQGPEAQPGSPPLTWSLTTTLHSGDELRFGGAIRLLTTDGTYESLPPELLQPRRLNDSGPGSSRGRLSSSDQSNACQPRCATPRPNNSTG